MTKSIQLYSALSVCLAAIISTTASHAQTVPTGDYDCTPSVVFQFDETGSSFGVAAVLSTDTVFTKLPTEPGATLVYQAGGASYLIDPLEPVTQ